MILPRSWVGDPFISFPDVEIAYFQSSTIDAGVRRYSLWAGRGRGSIEQTKDRQTDRERETPETETDAGVWPWRILENWRTVVGCTVVLSQARTAVDPDAGKKRGGNEVEELADEAREREEGR